MVSLLFEMKQGLKQGCCIAPLLFNIYVSTVIEFLKEELSQGVSKVKFHTNLDLMVICLMSQG